MEKLLWGWLTGILLLWFWSYLAHPAWALLPTLLAIFFYFLARWLNNPVYKGFLGSCAPLIFGVALGLGWSLQQARAQLASWLPESCVGQVITVSGRIVGLPDAQRVAQKPFQGSQLMAQGTSQLNLRVRFRPDANQCVCLTEHALWQLYWPSTAKLPLNVQPDQRWQLTVRLKPPHGYANPGGFDAERWLHQEAISATGRVVSATFLAPAGLTVNGLRWQIREQFLARFPQQQDSAGTVLALLTGDRVAISNAAWARYARTGITHLVAISGVHITMVAWAAANLWSVFWRRWPRALLWQPAQRIAGLVGWLAAAAYGTLAGLELPTQRTLLMLAIIIAMRWLPGEFSARQMLLTALALVLLHDPLAIHSASLWLSFTAVALLMLATPAYGQESGLRAMLRAQWLATWGLMPLSLALFARISWVSLPINLIAIPWITFVVVPLAMLGLLAWPLHEGLSSQLWSAAVYAMVWLDTGLAWASAWPWAASDFALPETTALWLGLALACFILPRVVPGRCLLLLPLAVVFWPHPRLQSGQMRLTVLDVGQGLAVHVATAKHHLIYDTGPGTSLSENAGARIILPYLRWWRVSALDAVMLSHDDLDHTGGLGSLINALPVSQVWGLWPTILADWPVAKRVPVQACAARQRWQWDGVQFDVLWPYPEHPMPKDNDASCVLRIQAQGHVVLITGDLEARGEVTLLELARAEQLRADLLILGHHGSKTSTTPRFLATVAPKEVIAAVGYRNRYRHPSPVVLARLQAAGIPGWRSDGTGALRYDFLMPGKLPLPQRWRLQNGHYWHLPMKEGAAQAALARATLGALTPLP